MNRSKLFITNILSYGIINIVVKAIPLIFLPIITKMLPNSSDFGVYSMYILLVGFGVPMVIMGLVDAMFREAFEKKSDDYQINVIYTAQKVVFFTSIIISILLLIFSESISVLFFKVNDYRNIVMFSALGVFLSSNLEILQAPTRILNQRKKFLILGVIQSSLQYGGTVLFIYLGYSYYGIIIGSFISLSVVAILYFYINRRFFFKGKLKLSILKELYKIGLPLMPTFMIYWIYNSMDKIMISNILGTGELGVYSVGLRLAQVSQIILAAYGGGIQFFRYKTMNDKDQVKMSTNIFSLLMVASIAFFVIVFPFIKTIFHLLFRGDYVIGYIVSPYLFLSPLILMLFQTIGGQFLIIKKTYFSTSSLLVGAVVNVVLNYVLIKAIGIEGAGIATLTGYIVSLSLICIIALKKEMLIFRMKTLISFITLIIYIVVVKFIFIDNFKIHILFSLIELIILLLLHIHEFKQILYKVKIMLNRKRNNG